MSEEKEELSIEEQNLCTIKGIGPVTAAKLVEKGITSIEQLAIMRPEEFADVAGITKKAAKDIVNNAKTIALDKAITISTLADTIKHYKEVVQRIPTGSNKFDLIMKGGVPTEAITMVKGEYASGKSQLGFQLAVNCLKYLKRKVIWVETETGTFTPDRILEMAKAVGLVIDDEKDILHVGSQNISTPYSLMLAIERVAQEIEKKNLDVGLIVIDSFTAPFRYFYTGREMLPDRDKEEGRQLGFLDHLAKKYNLAVFLTGQVMDIPDTGQQLGERVKSGHIKRIWGGNPITHGCTYLISLQQVAGVQWEGIIFDAPNIPRSSFRFKIVGAGIRDV
jgi:DNA repair protein RadA